MVVRWHDTPIGAGGGTFGHTSPANPASVVQSSGRGERKILVGDWYYIGHYGQLGPLTREQIDELVQGGVIARETYVWRSGMTDWLPAEKVPDLTGLFQSADPMLTPPPPPGVRPTATASPPTPSMPNMPLGNMELATVGYGLTNSYTSPKSSLSRVLGGVLQLVVPGVGRIYLGYAAIGVLQLLLSLCGVGWIWSVIDGLIILTGGVKMDGYGRTLSD